jgi:hypothetical protein
MLRSSESWDSAIRPLSSRKTHPPPLVCIPKCTGAGGRALSSILSMKIVGLRTLFNECCDGGKRPSSSEV